VFENGDGSINESAKDEKYKKCFLLMIKHDEVLML
jgi:hypothetical protein